MVYLDYTKKLVLKRELDGVMHYLMFVPIDRCMCFAYYSTDGEQPMEFPDEFTLEYASGNPVNGQMVLHFMEDYNIMYKGNIIFEMRFAPTQWIS
jgi:hypothetical protein